MDRRPAVEARPPVLIETPVRLSIPPACREHVIGDLWERYRSPRSFLLDAVRTVPFVVASQIRRSSKIGALLVQGFLLVVGFGVGAGSLVVSIVPVVAALLGLVLRDAYKSCVSLSAGHVVRDVAYGAGFVMASQMVVALVRPGLLLPLPAAISGAVALGMIFFLRLQNPGLGAHLRQHIATPPASLDALVREVRLDEGLTLRATRIEMVAGLAVGAFFLIPMVTAPNMALGVGWALATAYGLYVAAIMSRHRPRPLPDGLGFNDSLAFYRTTLESRRSLLRKMWIWYALPFTPAVLFIAIGGALVAAERGRPLWPVAILPLVALGIGLLIHRSSQDMVRKLDVRIDALASAEERSR